MVITKQLIRDISQKLDGRLYSGLTHEEKELFLRLTETSRLYGVQVNVDQGRIIISTNSVSAWLSNLIVTRVLASILAFFYFYIAYRHFFFGPDYAEYVSEKTVKLVSLMLFFGFPFVLLLMRYLIKSMVLSNKKGREF